MICFPITTERKILIAVFLSTQGQHMKKLCFSLPSHGTQQEEKLSIDTSSLYTSDKFF